MKRAFFLAGRGSLFPRRSEIICRIGPGVAERQARLRADTAYDHSPGRAKPQNSNEPTAPYASAC
jgi:hypothetical protein